MAFLFGLMDYLTWGEWFRSAYVYLSFNAERSESFGVAPFGYYVATLWTAMGWAFVVMAGLALLAFERARTLSLLVLAYLFIHSLLGHKELRFMVTIFPLLGALAAIGLDEAGRRWGTVSLRVAAAAAGGTVLLGLASFGSLTFRDIGQELWGRPTDSAYDVYGSVNRLLLLAHERPDLCGLRIESVRLAWTGSYSYLHRNVPLYSANDPHRASDIYNYVIGPGRTITSGQVLAQDGDYVLASRPERACGVR